MKMYATHQIILRCDYMENACSYNVWKFQIHKL